MLPRRLLFSGRIFACPGTVWSRPVSRNPSCCGTARTPGTCGTSQSSSMPGGTRGAVPRPVTWNSPGSSPPRGQAARGSPRGRRRCSSRRCGTSTRAMAGFFAGTRGRPSWRKAGRDEGFRVTGQRGQQWDVRRLNRNRGQVRVPKAGWVRFCWSRDVPAGRAVVPGDAGPGGPLACRVRGYPRSGPGTGDRGGRGHRPGRDGQRGAVDRGDAHRAAPDRPRAGAAARGSSASSPGPGEDRRGALKPGPRSPG